MEKKNKTHIRNPKHLGGTPGKHGLCEQDIEDFEQEKLIQEWLKTTGEAAFGEFEFKHISSKGTARNTIDQRSIRLDAQMRDEKDSGTFADIVAGSDGRDLECRLDGPEPEPKTASEILEENIDLFFDAIGASEGTKKWAKKSIKSAESLRQLRSLMKEEKPFEISPINLELPRRLANFRK